MLAGVDGSLKMQWTKSRRSAKQNHFYVAGQQLFIRIEPDESVILVDSDARVDRGVFGEILQAPFELILEYVSHCHEFDIFVG